MLVVGCGYLVWSWGCFKGLGSIVKGVGKGWSWKFIVGSVVVMVGVKVGVVVVFVVVYVVYGYNVFKGIFVSSFL